MCWLVEVRSHNNVLVGGSQKSDDVLVGGSQKSDDESLVVTRYLSQDFNRTTSELNPIFPIHSVVVNYCLIFSISNK